MSDEITSDPTEESAAIDPPGTTGAEPTNLDAQTGAPSDGAIDPPGTT